MPQPARRSGHRITIMLCGLVFILLLHLHESSSLATGQLGAGRGTTWRPGGGGGGEEEEEEPISMVDRSAQIIKEQDAEEGERWEESAWAPDTDSNNNHIISNNNVNKDNDDDDNNNSKDNNDSNNNNNNSKIQARTLCKKPTPPEHGYITGKNYDDGGVVRIFCDDGYRLSGPNNITCIPVPHPGARGVWLPEDEYRCLPVEPNVIEIRTLGAKGIKTGPSYTVLKGDIREYEIANPPSTLPLILIQNAVMARASFQTSGHRRTDTLPDATQVEGLPTQCSLPKVVGPCKAAIPRYYFNTTVHECLPFSYGGCRGNDNNFETFSDCQETCR